MVDVSQHEMVPEHTPLDEAAVEEMLADYGIDRTELPKIERTDPAIPDDAEVGDVVKIVRESRTTDQAVVYRLVID